MDSSYAKGRRERDRPFSEKAETPEWIDLYALGVYTLRLPVKDFWHLTLAQFDALIKRYNHDQEREDYRAGLICAVIANAHRDPKKRRKAFKPKDFMPKKQNKKGLSLQEVRAMHIAAGGDDVFPQPDKEYSQEELKLIVENIKKEANGE